MFNKEIALSLNNPQKSLDNAVGANASENRRLVFSQLIVDSRVLLRLPGFRLRVGDTLCDLPPVTRPAKV